MRGAVRRGVVDYLLKPFEFADLRQRLRAVRRAAAARSTARHGDGPGRRRPRRSAVQPAPLPAPVALPKGMSAETGELVEGGAARADDTLSATECADARRHLARQRPPLPRALRDHRQADVPLRYGSTGRPSVATVGWADPHGAAAADAVRQMVSLHPDRCRAVALVRHSSTRTHRRGLVRVAA